MNKLESIFAGGVDELTFAAEYLKYISELVKTIDPKPVAEFMQCLEEARKSKKQIFFIGNGGSAATASHFANDIGAGPRAWSEPYRAISLTDNVPLITAIANDHGYEQIFTRQLQLLMQPGDVVVGISASGNSPNIISAMEYALSRKGKTVGLTGFDGGALKKLADICIHVNTAKGEYGPVEDLHMIVDHLVGAYLALKNKSGLARVTKLTG